MASNYYSYHPRGIASAQAKIPAKAIFTYATIKNVQSQYTRPKLIAAGPQPMIQPNNTVWPWPWFCPAGPPSEAWIGGRIERINWWPLHEKGTIRIALRLLGAGYYFYRTSGKRPFDTLNHPIAIPLNFTVRISQYANSPDPSPVEELASPIVTHQQTINAYSATDSYIGSTILQQVWHQFLPSPINMTHTPSTKLCQAGPEDQLAFQNVYIDVNYDLSGRGSFSSLRVNPFFITISCDPVDVNDVIWPSTYNGEVVPVIGTTMKNLEFIRIFNTSSSYYEQGRL